MLEFIVFLLGFGAGAAGAWFILGSSDADSEYPPESLQGEKAQKPKQESRPGAASLAGEKVNGLHTVSSSDTPTPSAPSQQRTPAHNEPVEQETPSPSIVRSEPDTLRKTETPVRSQQAGEPTEEASDRNGPVNVRPAPKRTTPKKRKGASPAGKAARKKKIAQHLDGKGEEGTIDNQEVGGALNVSDATAKRYLKELESEGAIEQVKEAGKAKYRRPRPAPEAPSGSGGVDTSTDTDGGTLEGNEGTTPNNTIQPH